MPKFISIEMLGAPELQAALKDLPIAVQRKIVRAALREAGRPMLSDAKTKVPVDTGKLRDSLKLRALKPKRGSFGVRIATGTRQELGIKADDPYYYPMAVETGTRKMSPRSFLRWAFQKNKTRALTIIKNFLARGIYLEAQKARRGGGSK